MAFSFPFRYSAQGSVALVEPGSDQEVHELIAGLCLTKTGERVLEPDFGLTDPDWEGIAESDVMTGVEEYGPEGIDITGVTVQEQGSISSAYVVGWEREPVEVENV